MMGHHSIGPSCAGAGRPTPLSDSPWCWWQSRLPDPQKKKKKKSGKKQRLDLTTTAKRFRLVSLSSRMLMVVMDTWPGSTEDLWLCSRATELAAAAPAGPSLIFLPRAGLFPTFSAVGRDDYHTDIPQSRRYSL